MANRLHLLQVLQQAARGDRLLRFEGMGDTIRLARSAATVADALDDIAASWPRAEPIGSARIRVSGRNGAFRLASPWLTSAPLAQSPTSAACALIIEMARSWLNAHTGMLCLHCAAFEQNGRLIVLAGTNRSGKSTLAAALGAAGARIFCDDMLPLTPDGKGMAFGIPPRLRLPLPEALDGTLAEKAAAGLVSADARYGYTSPENLAPHGETAPLGGIVLLDRTDSGAPSFHAVERSEGLSQLLLRNLHRDIGAGDTIERLLDIAGSVPVTRLRYAHVDEAVEALLGLAPQHWPGGVPAPDTIWTSEHSDIAIEPSAPFRHTEGVGTHEVDGELFAVHPETEEIFRLNEVAAILWDMFAEPTSVEDAVEILAEAFTDEDRSHLGRDVATLVSALVTRNLIGPA